MCYSISLPINVLINCERHNFVFKKCLLKLMVTSKVGTVWVCSIILPQNANHSTFIIF